MRIPIILLIAITLPLCLSARKTTLKLKPEIKKERQYAPTEADSAAFVSLKNSITFSGFDKPASSRKETFLITNDSPQYISSLEIEITYLDPEQRMLHSRRERIDTAIPAGETRQVSIKSFDTQGTYYYIKSKPPKTGGQPFQVTIISTKIFLPR